MSSSITAQGRALISSASMMFESFLSNSVKFGSLDEVLVFINNVRKEKREFPDEVYVDNPIDVVDCFAKVIDSCGYLWIPNDNELDIIWKTINNLGQRDLNRIYYKNNLYEFCSNSIMKKMIIDMMKKLDEPFFNPLEVPTTKIKAKRAGIIKEVTDDNIVIQYEDNVIDVIDLKIVQSKDYTKILTVSDGIIPGSTVKEKDLLAYNYDLVDDLEMFAKILGEYVLYDKMIIDRIDRCDNMMKSTIMISDTDSCIVSLDAWYRFVLQLIEGQDITIRKYDPISIFDFIEKDEFGDIVNKEVIQPFKEYGMDERFDFDNDEIRYQKHVINPFEILPQDYIRWSIVNLLAFVIDKFINRYMLQFTKNNHSWAPEKPCKIIMKNEFSFNRMLITNVKKNYATIQKVQEGNLIPKSEQLDVKGIAAIAKSSTAKSTRNEFKKILLEDIMTAPAISQAKIVEKLCIMEKRMIQSIQSGSKEYYKPVTIKAMNSYADPMRIQGIKASYAWNILNEGSGLPLINLEERNAVDIAKIYLNSKNVDELQERYPEVYEKALKLLENQYFKGSVDAIAIPHDLMPPDWLLDIIDYKKIVNDNMTGFPFDSVGLGKINKKTTIYSNILNL